MSSLSSAGSSGCAQVQFFPLSHVLVGSARGISWLTAILGQPQVGLWHPGSVKCWILSLPGPGLSSAGIGLQWLQMLGGSSCTGSARGRDGLEPHPNLGWNKSSTCHLNLGAGVSV